MSDFAGLQLALSGLLAHRRSSETIGHNVANANTEGYSRQRVDLVARGASVVPAFWSRWERGGAGVDVAGITRIRDEFLERRFLKESAVGSGLTRLSNVMDRIEAAFPEPSDTGIGTQLAEFWGSWDDVANSPDDLAVRTALLERGTTIAQAFNRASSELTALRDGTVDQIGAVLGEVNAMAAQIAELNLSIRRAVAADLHPNDLMDQRDLLVTKLTKLVGVTVQDGDFGTVDVFVGGTALVRNDRFETLELDTSNAPTPGTPLANVGWNQAVVRWSKDDYPADVSAGEVWALLQGANDAVPRYLDELNTLANQLVTQVNALHQTGYGLADAQQPAASPSRRFFAPVVGPPYTNAAANLSLDAAVDGQPANIAASNGTGALDVSIAQQLAAMTTSATGPDASFRQLVGSLGVEVQTLNRRSQIQDEVTLQVNQSRLAVSGVNIDEEMTNLVQSQHAYNASARLMTTIDEMIDTLINRTGVVGR